MSAIEQDLIHLKESSEDFFINYIKPFHPKMGINAFNKFRLDFINLITDVSDKHLTSYTLYRNYLSSILLLNINNL